MSLKKYVEKERKFLHDMSNKLLIAQGMATINEMKLSSIKESDGVDEVIEKNNRAISALNEAIELIKNHKEYVYALDEKK